MINGEHVCLLKFSISKNRTKENDENLSELELKSFWYKLHKKVFVEKWIKLYISQFLTIFDEPKTKLKVINVITRLCNTCYRLTSCNQFQLVFEQFWMIFEMRQLATGITPNLGNHNRKIDWTTVQFGLVLWNFLVQRTEPANTRLDSASILAQPWLEPATSWSHGNTITEPFVCWLLNKLSVGLDNRDTSVTHR